MAPARFVTDSSLEFLARRLRFLGYDVEVLRGARLEELFDAARRNDRRVLTLSARHPRRWADVDVTTVPRHDVGAVVRAIAERFEPAGAPFSRCPACNTALQRRHALEARGEVPGGVLRGSHWLYYCPTCGKWYWVGSHVDRLREWLTAATGRPVPRPPLERSEPDAG